MTDEVRRGMDVLYFDPLRKRPEIGRPGKVSGLGADGRVHLTILTDPDLDRMGPFEEVRNVRLVVGHVPPRSQEAYCRPVERDVVRTRRVGRPRKDEQASWRPEMAMAVQRRA